MMKSFILKAIFIYSLCSVSFLTQAQPIPFYKSEGPTPSSAKPYRILTNGKQITIQSTQELKSIMVWTSSGHRIVEEKEVKNTNYSFTVPAKEKVVFMMAQMTNGKRFTEKIGVK